MPINAIECGCLLLILLGIAYIMVAFSFTAIDLDRRISLIMVLLITFVIILFLNMILFSSSLMLPYRYEIFAGEALLLILLLHRKLEHAFVRRNPYEKIILYLTTSTVLLLTCLSYHVNQLFPKDIPFDNSDKARSALAGMTIETTFGMQDSGRTLYLDLKDGEITQRYTRQSTQEKQKIMKFLWNVFLKWMNRQKAIGKPKNLSEEGHEIKELYHRLMRLMCSIVQIT